MAILGGGVGGAGNPVGGSYTGPAEALEIIGDHAYGYSGAVAVGAVQNTFYPLLSFTTGNFYTVGEVQIGSTTGSNDNHEIKLELNDSPIMLAEFQNAPQEFAYGYTPWNIIIPPYTKVALSLANVANASSNDWFMTLTARIYRTRD